MLLGAPLLFLVLADAKPQPAVDFARDVYPILQRTCFECHGPERQRGKLRLDQRETALKGGGGGPVIVAGKADGSELYRRIALPKGHAEIMPARGTPLSRAQTELIRNWINQGAVWPENVQLAKHWAYVKPVQVPIPKVKDTAWPRNALDYFVLARLGREGLTPSPPASREQLLRRVSLDLIGLPPTPAEIDAFLEDDRPNAYERVVERLLSSPAYGERWARPWLDLAHYADSHGFQRDDLRDMWPYRDWVVRALNADLPFDQFTVEQLAGDLLPDATVEQRVATGFHRCVTTNVEAGSDQEETRVNQVFDRVNTTATVWLGTTLECAQCHDHKYDPFSQKEYYRKRFAFLRGHPTLAASRFAFARHGQSGQDELAFRMQTSVPELMDINQETQETLALYGAEPGKVSFANNCLLARRLVERGVRMVQLYDADWDHHADLATRLPLKCRQVDRPMAALLLDLKRRGLLDETLIIWGGEFGRTPMQQTDSGAGAAAKPGRDHHKDAFTVWLAGGGVKRGHSHGKTDEFGYSIEEHPVHVHDLNATVLHLLGIDHERLTYRYQGREFRLTDVHGRVVKEILA